MLRELYKIVFLHVSVGYVYLLLGITVTVDLLGVLDIYRYERSGRSLEPAITAMWTGGDLWKNIPLLLFFFLVIAPSFLSIFRVLIGSREIGGTEFWVSERWAIFSQIGACVLLGLGYALSRSYGQNNQLTSRNGCHKASRAQVFYDEPSTCATPSIGHAFWPL